MNAQNYNNIYYSYNMIITQSLLASQSVPRSSIKFENPRVALNNELVASDDFLVLKATTFDPVGEEESPTSSAAH